MAEDLDESGSNTIAQAASTERKPRKKKTDAPAESADAAEAASVH